MRDLMVGAGGERSSKEGAVASTSYPARGCCEEGGVVVSLCRMMLCWVVSCRLMSYKGVVLLLWVMLGVGVGCNPTESEAPNQPEGDPSVEQKEGPLENPKVKICEPNQELGCVKEGGLTAQKCSADGFAVVTYSCSSNQQPRICQKGRCKEVLCIPKSGRCVSDTEVERCREDGSGWEPGERCQGVERCSDGQCLDACGQAEAEGSYIGCDYWATNLDNPYLSYSAKEDAILLPKEEQPPFAIVLANMSQEKDSWVTVFKDFNLPADLIASRTVGKEGSGVVPLTTVYSEIQASNGTVIKRLSGQAKNLVLPRNSTMTLLLETENGIFNASSVRKSAFHIRTSEPVVAYQFNPFCCNYSYTNDASLLLPTATLTQRYLNIGYPVFAGSQTSDIPTATTLTIVATSHETEVKVRLGENVTPDGVMKGLTKGSHIVSYNPTSRLLTTTLDAYQVLNLSAQGVTPRIDDLTGTEVLASKPVAVFSGHACAFTPFDLPACDHLESQLLPRETWAQNYIATPLKLRGDPNRSSREGTYFKFVAEQNNTVIDVGIPIDIPNVLGVAGEGQLPCQDFSQDPKKGTFTLHARQSCTFGTKIPFLIKASAPIQVGAFLSGQASVKDAHNHTPDFAGDPSFFILPPEDQYRTDYSFFAPPTYHSNYVTVTAPKGVGFFLDQVSVDINSPHIDRQFTPKKDWVQYNLPISPGPHQIQATTPVGIVVYGYHNYVSYAYVGGLDLTKLRLLTDSF